MVGKKLTRKKLEFICGVNKMKGQFFIIATIIVLLGLFMIRNLFNVYDTVRRQTSYSSDISDMNLMQIGDEYKRIIDFQPDNLSVMNNLWNFSLFLTNKIDGFHHFSFIIFSNDDNLSIVVENFLPYDIVNLSMSTPDFYYNFSTISNGDNEIVNLHDTNISIENITISYSCGGQWIVEKLPVNTTGEKKIHAFLDNYIEKNNIYLEKKDFYIREINN